MLRCRLKLEGSQTLNSQLFAIKAGIFYSLLLYFFNVLYNLIFNLSHFWDIRILTGRAVLFGSGWTDTHITDRSQVWTPWQLMCHVKSFLEWETESISSMLKLLCEAAAGMIIWDGSHKDSVQESRWGGPARSPDSHSRNSTAQWLQHNTTQHRRYLSVHSSPPDATFVSTHGMRWLTCGRVCAVSGEEVSPSAHDNLNCHEPD